MQMLSYHRVRFLGRGNPVWYNFSHYVISSPWLLLGFHGRDKWFRQQDISLESRLLLAELTTSFFFHLLLSLKPQVKPCGF
jgi:hypothetical protein